MRDIGKGPWRSGPPPSVGWWPASASRNRDGLRWFNGVFWMAQAYRQDDARAAAFYATTPTASSQSSIKWRERADWWPERSRT